MSVGRLLLSVFRWVLENLFFLFGFVWLVFLRNFLFLFGQLCPCLGMFVQVFEYSLRRRITYEKLDGVQIDTKSVY